MKWSLGALLIAASLIACEQGQNRLTNQTSHQHGEDAPHMQEHVHATLDEEIETIAKIREQQFKDEELFMQGLSDISSHSCRYRSSIGTKAPHRKVALTFDDGPDAILTPKVLGILKKYRIKGTFFVTGTNARRHTQILKQAEAEGHLIGNHSWSHQNFHQLSFGQQSQQYVSTENVISSFRGGKKYFRYPYGNSSCETNNLLKSRGYKIVGWHIDSCDWGFEQTGVVKDNHAKICGVSAANKANFVGHVLSTTRAKGGGILLFHDIRGRAMGNLESIIQGLLRDGFEFVNLDDPSMQSSLF